MADEQKGTAYVVLGLMHEVNWALITTEPVMATNDLAAIRKVVSGRDDVGPGPFVAVPARSWRPRKREVKSVQRELWT